VPPFGRVHKIEHHNLCGAFDANRDTFDILQLLDWIPVEGQKAGRVAVTQFPDHARGKDRLRGCSREHVQERAVVEDTQ